MNKVVQLFAPSVLVLSASTSFALPLFVLLRGGLETLFDAPLNSNGVTAADPAVSWPVTGVTAPLDAWWCDDRTGAIGLSTTTFTETGAVDLVDSPFCPDGGWSDITNGCLKACRFDGVNDYFTAADATSFQIGSADGTFVVIYRTNSAPAGSLAGSREGGAGEGWTVAGSASTIITTVENHAGTVAARTWNTVPIEMSWNIFAFTFDFDGNLVPYVNAEADGATASPGGVIASTAPFQLGARGDNGSKYTGDLLAAFWWPSVISEADLQDLLDYFGGILDTKGAPVTFTSVAPYGCWIDGMLSVYGDDMAALGCELPPSVTGFGNPATGFLLLPLLTNSLPFSRDLDSWTDIGTPTPTATSTDLFRGGRQTYRICDDDAGSVEGSQSGSIDITALNAGDKVQFCFYVKDATGDVFDVQTVESGVCAGATTDYVDDELDITWKQVERTHTILDTTCTTLTLRISPTIFDSAADTGCVEVVSQAFLNQDWCPPIYIGTSAAAVSAGDTGLSYSIASTSLASGVADGTVIEFDYWSFRSAPPTATAYFFEIEDSATANDFYRLIHGTTGILTLSTRSTEEGVARAIYVSSAPFAPTPGTLYHFKVTITSAAGTVEVNGSPLVGTHTPLSAPPDSLDNLCIGLLCGGTNQIGAWIANFEVTQ